MVVSDVNQVMGYSAGFRENRTLALWQVVVESQCKVIALFERS